MAGEGRGEDLLIQLLAPRSGGCAQLHMCVSSGMCVHTSVCACMCVCLQACVCAHQRVHLHVCIPIDVSPARVTAAGDLTG